MKRLLNILVVLLIIQFTSCNSKLNEKFPENIEKYEKAKELLLEHFDEINELALNDSVNEIIMYANKVFFEENLPGELISLKEITALWDNELMEDSPMFGIISMHKDSTIIFTADYEFLGFSGIGHYIVYDPNEKKGNLGKHGKGILDEKQIKEKWIYIIDKKHPQHN